MCKSDPVIACSELNPHYKWCVVRTGYGYLAASEMVLQLVVTEH